MFLRSDKNGLHFFHCGADVSKWNKSWLILFLIVRCFYLWYNCMFCTKRIDNKPLIFNNSYWTTRLWGLTVIKRLAFIINAENNILYFLGGKKMFPFAVQNKISETIRWIACKACNSVGLDINPVPLRSLLPFLWLDGDWSLSPINNTIATDLINITHIEWLLH